ncbi:MAG: maltokinase N-terminal cap-like domain-containing protein [Actinomycetota bacterium]
MEVRHLEAWLPAQRWFAGKGRDFQVVAVEPLPWLQQGRVRVRIEMVSVRYADRGEVETYQVPLEYRAEAAEHLAHALVGEGPDGWVYDALHDKEVTGLWVRGIADEADAGAVRFHRAPGAPAVPVDEPSLVVGTEQSNTSLVFGDLAILKVFRKVQPGLNPDIEIHTALAAAGSTDVAPPLGWVEGSWTDPVSGAPVDGSLAMLQTFLRSATGGWELAKTSVRDLFAEGDLHADEVGGDFAGESQRLGMVTARVHRALAAALPTGVLDRAGLVATAEAMTDRLRAAVADVPELSRHLPALQAAYDDLAAAQVPVPVQRIHGDYHLGQVMRTLDGWKLLDFEGEPSRPLAQRRALRPVLQDVAGMLRSFDYVARHLLAERPDPQLDYRATEWAERNRDAFCHGYAVASGRDPREDVVMLRALEIDKAVYEVVYEARNRPSWVPIPLSAISRLARSDAP